MGFSQSTHTSTHVSWHTDERGDQKLQYEAQREDEWPTEEILLWSHKLQKCCSAGKWIWMLDSDQSFFLSYCRYSELVKKNSRRLSLELQLRGLMRSTRQKFHRTKTPPTLLMTLRLVTSLQTLWMNSGVSHLVPNLTHSPSPRSRMWTATTPPFKT